MGVGSTGSWGLRSRPAKHVSVSGTEEGRDGPLGDEESGFRRWCKSTGVEGCGSCGLFLLKFFVVNNRRSRLVDVDAANAALRHGQLWESRKKDLRRRIKGKGWLEKSVSKETEELWHRRQRPDAGVAGFCRCRGKNPRQQKSGLWGRGQIDDAELTRWAPQHGLLAGSCQAGPKLTHLVAGIRTVWLDPAGVQNRPTKHARPVRITLNALSIGLHTWKGSPAAASWNGGRPPKPTVRRNGL